MHEIACETGSQILRPLGFDVLFSQAQMHCDHKPRQIGLNYNYMNLGYFTLAAIDLKP